MAAPALLSPTWASPAAIARYLPCLATNTGCLLSFAGFLSEIIYPVRFSFLISLICADKRNYCILKSREFRWILADKNTNKRTRLPEYPFATMCSKDKSVSPGTSEGRKKVWIWTEDKQVMTAAVERGWNTFLFSCRELADDWSCELIQTQYILSNCF